MIGINATRGIENINATHGIVIVAPRIGPALNNLVSDQKDKQIPNVSPFTLKVLKKRLSSRMTIDRDLHSTLRKSSKEYKCQKFTPNYAIIQWDDLFSFE